MSIEQSRELGKRSQESVQASNFIDSNMAPVADQKKEKETATDKKEETKSKGDTKKEEETELVTACFSSCAIVFVVISGKTKESRSYRDSSTFLPALCQRQLFKNDSFVNFYRARRTDNCKRS